MSQYYNSSTQLTQMVQPYSPSYSPLPRYTTTNHPPYCDTDQLGSPIPYFHNHFLAPHYIITVHPPYCENSQLDSSIPSYVYSNTYHPFGANELLPSSNNPYVNYLLCYRLTLEAVSTPAIDNTLVKNTECKKKKEPSSIKKSKESEPNEFDFSSSISNDVQWEDIFGELHEIVKLLPLFPGLE